MLCVSPTVTWVWFLPHGIAMSSKRAHGKPEDWPGTWCSPATCHLPPAVLCVWSREFSHLQNGDMLNTAGGGEHQLWSQGTRILVLALLLSSSVTLNPSFHVSEGFGVDKAIHLTELL